MMINYGRQTIGDEEVQAVESVLACDYITTGPQVGRFEDALKEYTGAKYCIACTSGTMALYLAYRAMGVGSGDVVSVPTNTFVATASTASLCGAKIAFEDIEETTLNRAPTTPRASVTVGVDFAGMPCPSDRSDNSLFLRDACHSLGSFDPATADITITSFHPVKTITTGEGGAVFTDNEDYRDTAYALLNCGRVDGLCYMHSINSRMTDFQAAMGLAQLKKIDWFLARRRQIAARYDEELEHLRAQSAPIGARHSWHLYIIRVKHRDEFQRRLALLGVGSQIHYYPVHLQPVYGGGRGEYPIAEQYADECLSIPIYPTLTDEQVELVIRSIKTVYETFDSERPPDRRFESKPDWRV